uniref:SFRICE_009801 n=1 Tax=Spodoptera frugiperda TaxID=7108 RepID=A0A2H1W5L2_SPOFR
MPLLILTQAKPLEGFYRDTMSLYICWECRAVMCRITRFRLQACTALKHLSDIADGRTNKKSTCLSRLSSQKLNEIAVTSKCMNTDNFINLTEDFIDCGPTVDLLIKNEYDDDDIPLSELNNWSDHDPATAIECKDELSTTIPNENELSKTIEHKDELSKIIDNRDELSKTIDNMDELSKSIDNGDELSKTIDNKDELSKNVLPGVKKKRKHVKKRFSVVSIDDSELEKMRKGCRLDALYLAASFKCDSCIEIFKSEAAMNEHNSLHLEKSNHTQCDICLVYTPTSSYTRHRQDHYLRYDCKLCKYTCLNEKAIYLHLETKHNIKEYSNKKIKSSKVALREDSTTTKLKDSSLEYKCDECDQYFGNKSARWKHVQKCHREGFECATCGQRFPFKNNLRRHEQ